MTPENTIPVFLQYGAMGILALAFITMLVLLIKADKRASQYAGALRETSFDRSKLIDVVSENSKAYTALAGQIQRFGEASDRHNAVISKLNARLENDRCALLKEGKQ
jgi:hypothetical protein